MASGWRGCNIGGGEEETKLGGSSYNHYHHSYHTGYPGDLKFPGRCASFETNFANQVLETNFFQLATKILSHLDDHFVCDQGGGTPLDSDLEQVPGEEAYSPAGGARGDGGDVE